MLAPHNRIEPGHEFARFKRFREIVVSTDFKTHHPIGNITSCRQHQQGDGAFRALTSAYFPAHIETIFLGQHHVEDNGIVGVACEFLQSQRGSERSINSNIKSGTVLRQQLGQLLIIAIQGGDVPTVQTLTFIFAILIVFFNLIADVLYGLLDPRIRYD